MKLSETLAQYDTDKIWFHRYGDAYDNLFARFDKNTSLNILEVGTQKGGSLLAWKEYFPKANVYGVDVIDVVPEKYRHDNVTRIISDIKEWKNDIKWDIIIDDGSHYLGDIVWVIAHYFPLIKVNGMIVIEDVRNPQLLGNVINELLSESRLGYPDYEEKICFHIRAFDQRRKGAESSYIIALIKESHE